MNNNKFCKFLFALLFFQNSTYPFLMPPQKCLAHKTTKQDCVQDFNICMILIIFKVVNYIYFINGIYLYIIAVIFFANVVLATIPK